MISLYIPPEAAVPPRHVCHSGTAVPDDQITDSLLLTWVTPGADHAVVSARSRSYQVSTSPASVTFPPSAVTVMLSASIWALRPRAPTIFSLTADACTVGLIVMSLV